MDNTMTIARAPSSDEVRVKHFRQILLWPVYLMPKVDGPSMHDRWPDVVDTGPDSSWRVVDDEFTGDPRDFQERHYNEFVSFLPPVQRFLYGQRQRQREGAAAQSGFVESSIRVLRRQDVSCAAVTLSGESDAIRFSVAHIDLYFFFDVDVALLAVEMHADDLPLKTAQDAMFQLGRAYPAYWEEDGRPGHCPKRVEWLSADGAVLAASDYENREKFLTFVCKHRAPRVAAHWEFLLQPLVLHQCGQDGALRYRQLEYYRMPLMAYLAVDKPDRLTSADYVRLALVGGSGDPEQMPIGEGYFDHFKATHCYDLYRTRTDGRAWPSTTFWSCGHSFILTGDAGSDFFRDVERGYLARFRHQHFIMFMIAHFHRATLQMFSDELAGAMSRLDVRDAAAVASFRRETRVELEAFLRFTHRYWFQEISDQAQIHDLFAMIRRHLGIDRAYEAIRRETQDMSDYLENEAMRRQNESVVRLTVVTAFGLVGSVATGFLGMNLFDYTHVGGWTKLFLFVVVFVPIALLTSYTIKKSRRLSDFLDAIADESLDLAGKWRAFRRIW